MININNLLAHKIGSKTP